VLDPMLCAAENDAFGLLGCEVLSSNQAARKHASCTSPLLVVTESYLQEGMFAVERPTVFFMPHCEVSASSLLVLVRGAPLCLSAVCAAQAELYNNVRQQPLALHALLLSGATWVRSHDRATPATGDGRQLEPPPAAAVCAGQLILQLSRSPARGALATQPCAGSVRHLLLFSCLRPACCRDRLQM